MSAGISAIDLTVRFGQITALRAVTLSVSPGEVAVIIGRSGAGKSTLLRAMLGLVPRLEGELRVCGLDPRRESNEIRRRVTYVANPDVFEPHLTIRRNVTHILQLADGLSPSADEVDRALRDADVPDRDLSKPARGIGGRVALSLWLGIARLRGSSAVLLDDPAKYLRPTEATHLASLVRELAATGPAVVVATSDPKPAEEAADSAYLLAEGHLSFMHAPAGLRAPDDAAF